MAQTNGQASPSAPRAAVEAFFAALERNDGHELASLLHPDVLRAFQEEELAIRVGWAEVTDGGKKPLGGTGGYSARPLTPELAAKYADVPIRGVPGVQTLGQLIALTSEQFFAKVIEARVTFMAEAGSGGLEEPKGEIVGEVLEGDSLAHVLYRSKFTRRGEALVPLVSVTSVRREGSRWLVLPDFFLMGSLKPPSWMWHDLDR